MRPFPLGTDRLLLDQPTDQDVDEIARLCRDPVFERLLTIPVPYTRAHAESFVGEFVPGGWESGDELTWAIRMRGDDRLRGVVSFRTPGADLGFWLGAEDRGRGIVPEAVSAVIDHVFASGGDRVEWECVAGNTASAAVARKCGFSYTGEAPSRAPGRGGTHPASWHGVLRAGDDRAPKPGWPA